MTEYAAARPTSTAWPSGEVLVMGLFVLAALAWGPGVLLVPLVAPGIGLVVRRHHPTLAHVFYALGILAVAYLALTWYGLSGA